MAESNDINSFKKLQAYETNHVCSMSWLWKAMSELRSWKCESLGKLGSQMLTWSSCPQTDNCLDLLSLVNINNTVEQSRAATEI